MTAIIRRLGRTNWWSAGVLVALLVMALSIPFASAEVRRQTIASGLSTNTTSTAMPAEIAASHNPGPKSFYGQVVGTGAVTQTQAIYGDIDNDAANGVLLCTITLSGTTRTQDACPVITAQFAFYYVITTNTTGTGATGAVYAMY